MTTITAPRSKPNDSQEVLHRYPRLTAHLVCESLGYLTPLAAANAILSHIQAQPFACEWYLHMARKDRPLIQVNENIISMAFRRRHSHTGFMADHRSAQVMVEKELNGGRPATLMAW